MEMLKGVIGDTGGSHWYGPATPLNVSPVVGEEQQQESLDDDDHNEADNGMLLHQLNNIS